MGVLGGRGVATMAWALAELRLSPPPAWIYQLVNAARPLLPSTPPPPPAAADAAADTSAGSGAGRSSGAELRGAPAQAAAAVLEPPLELPAFVAGGAAVAPVQEPAQVGAQGREADGVHEVAARRRERGLGLACAGASFRPRVR